MDKLQDVLDIQENQDFSKASPYIRIDRLIPRKPPDRNAVYYLVDCRNSEIVGLSGDTYQLFGKTNDEISHVSHFYECISKLHYDGVVDTTEMILRWAVHHNNDITPFRNRATLEVAIDRKGRTSQLIRETMVAHVNRDGVLTHTMGVYYPMSGTTGGDLKIISGPYSEYVPYPDAMEFKGVFSRSEIQILNRLANGHSNRHIANELNLSIRTIETHRKNMLRKIEARNTPNLIYLAMRMGLIKC